MVGERHVACRLAGLAVFRRGTRVLMKLWMQGMQLHVKSPQVGILAVLVGVQKCWALSQRNH